MNRAVRPCLVLGWGQTGQSVARFLQRQGEPCWVYDTRCRSGGTAASAGQPLDGVWGGVCPASWLREACRVIISPGLDPRDPAWQLGRDRLCTDVDLFMEAVDAPVVGITGTNGKSTVTTWTAQLLRDAGWSVSAGGNLGPPALDLLATPSSLYVLELSSYQLAVASDMRLTVGGLLNVSPDHLDRHGAFEAYAAVKQRVFAQAEHAVYHTCDPHTFPPASCRAQHHGFGLRDHRKPPVWHVTQATQTVQYRNTALGPVWSGMHRHEQCNALASCAVGTALGVSPDALYRGIQSCRSLPHRCRLTRTHDGISWYNDSKGTNLGAAEAAIDSLASPQHPLVWIAGGQAKGVDFSCLSPHTMARVAHAVVLGEHRELLEQALQQHVPVHRAEDMPSAVRLARQWACAPQVVLLSPACASWDMFQGYRHRGEVFEQCVWALD